MQNTSNTTQPQVNNSILLQNKIGKAVLKVFANVEPTTLNESINELKRIACKHPKFKSRSKQDRKVLLSDAEVLSNLLYGLHFMILSHDSQVAQYRKQSILNSERVEAFLSSLIG